MGKESAAWTTSISENGAQKARALAADAKVDVEFSVADCDPWLWPDDGYGAVVAIFFQFADPRQLEFNSGGPPFLSHLSTDDMLRSAFASLAIVNLREDEADLAEATHGRKDWSGASPAIPTQSLIARGSCRPASNVPRRLAQPAGLQVFSPCPSSPTDRRTPR